MFVCKNLKCQYLEYPIGVDTFTLTFSWHVHTDERDWFQTACRIQVLEDTAGVVFDTGVVESSRQSGLYWTIPALVSNRRYQWRVRVRNTQGKFSDWSRPAVFVTGLMRPEEWKGKLLHGCDLPGIDPYRDTVCFRRTVELDGAADLALVHVASAGIHELYVNGQRVGERVMAPSRTNLTDYTRLRSVTYDVTAYMRPGNNVVGIWLDAGWTRQSGVQPAVIAQVEISSKDRHTAIPTDESWLCRKSRLSHIGGCYEWSDFGGEHIDAAETADWSAPEYRAEGWSPAGLLQKMPRISWDQSDGDRVRETFPPVSVVNRDGTAKIDMGKNYTGWVSIRLRDMRPGDLVRVLVSDKEQEEVSFGQCSEYLAAGPEGEFCNRFQYAAGRYVTVYGLRCALCEQDVTGLAISTAVRRHGELKTSLPLQEQIFELDAATFYANTMGGVICDCPHRERLGYGEAGTSNIWGPGIHVADTRAFVRQMFENWRDVQQENGYMPHVAPNFYGGGGISWGSCLTVCLWETCQYMRDRTLLAENYPAACAWADYLALWIHDGLLRCPPEESRSHLGFLGDWAYWEGNDLSGSAQANFFNSCQAARVLRITADMADILQDTARSRRYRTLWRDMAQAVHKQYYDAQTQRYFQGEQRYAAAALCAGIVPPRQRQTVQQTLLDSLRTKGYMDGGSVGTVLIYQALEDIPEGKELLFSWLQSTQVPSYGWFLAQGENTMPELWSMEAYAGESRIHTCYSGITGWYARTLVGLRPMAEQTNSFVLDPFFPREMEWLSWKADYGFGPISIQWSRADGIEYCVEIPANMRVYPAGVLGDAANRPVWGSGSHTVRVPCAER